MCVWLWMTSALHVRVREEGSGGSKGGLYWCVFVLVCPLVDALGPRDEEGLGVIQSKCRERRGVRDIQVTSGPITARIQDQITAQSSGIDFRF